MNDVRSTHDGTDSSTVVQQCSLTFLDIPNVDAYLYTLYDTSSRCLGVVDCLRVCTHVHLFTCPS